MKIFGFLAVCAAIFLTSCGKDVYSDATAETLFPLRFGRLEFSAKFAVSDAEKARGLMGVKELPQNEGMVFVYQMPTMMSFWMKNTLIPLDIAFIDPEGVILQISQMYPHNEVPVRSASSKVLYSLEMNQGWFAKNQIKPGDKLDMELFAKALEARRKK